MNLPLRNDVDDVEYADLNQYRLCSCGYRGVVFYSLGSCDMTFENPDVRGFRIRLVTVCPKCKLRQTRALGFKAETLAVAGEATKAFDVCESLKASEGKLYDQ